MNGSASQNHGLLLLLALRAVVFPATAAPPAPVHWQDWSPMLFAQAARDPKFILVNVEAPWSHSCHRMNESTYANSDVIALLSASYVPVAVDLVPPAVWRRLGLAPSGSWRTAASRPAGFPTMTARKVRFSVTLSQRAGHFLPCINQLVITGGSPAPRPPRMLPQRPSPTARGQVSKPLLRHLRQRTIPCRIARRLRSLPDSPNTSSI
jgi:hypothetical protein